MPCCSEVCAARARRDYPGIPCVVLPILDIENEEDRNWIIAHGIENRRKAKIEAEIDTRRRALKVKLP